MGRVKKNALTPRTDKGRDLGESGRSFGRLYAENLTLNGTALAATAAELNAAADQSAVVGLMSPSTVIAGKTTALYNVTTHRTGNIIKTTMHLTLIGLKSTATTNDVIGDTGACHFGRITTAVNGVIFKGQVSCAIVPTTGDDDIDIYTSTAATGAYDADASGLAGAVQIVASAGAYAIGTVKPFTALPAANSYLYLATGDATAGTYDAGVILIEMWGLAA